MKKRYSFVAMAAVFYMLGVVLFTGYEFFSTKKLLLNDADEKLLDVARTVPSILGKNYHISISPKKINQKKYLNTARALYDAIDGSGIIYIYSMIKSGDKILYTSCSGSPEDIAEGEVSSLFEEYEDASELLVQSFSSSEPVYESYEDSSGFFRSVLIPISAPDGSRYLVGADMEMNDINALVRRSLYFSFGKGVFLLLLILPLFWALRRKSKDERFFLESEIARNTEQISSLNEDLLKQINAAKASEELALQAKLLAEEARANADEANRAGRIEAAELLKEVTESLSATGNEISSQTVQALSGAREQQAKLQDASASISQLVGAITEIAAYSTEGADLSTEARASAQSGSEAVGNMNNAISIIKDDSELMQKGLNDLFERAEGIGDIVDVISDIADQTNLLALNAAIEAARAGEAGRGFAVVADEVRKLAEKTMVATNEVGTAISEIQAVTRNNVKNMQRSGEMVEETYSLTDKTTESLNDIVSTIEKSAEQSASIAAAADEQSSASEEVGRAVEDVSRIAGETYDSMDINNRNVAELVKLTARLQEIISEFQS